MSCQQISTVTRLIHDKHAPDYQKQDRELYPTEPGSLKFRGLAPGLVKKSPTVTYPTSIWHTCWGDPRWNFAEIFGT